jgi:DNA-binding response OmpR family regulator
VPDLPSYLYPCKEVTAVVYFHSQPTMPPLTSDAPGTAPLRVLIVEDDADTTSAFEILLQQHGLDVQTAPDGPSALAVAQSFQPEVVLLDLGLPRMSGYEVARRLKAKATGKSPFLIAVTGYGREEDRQKSAKAGIDLYLVKPADPAMLTGLLKRFRRVVR